MPVTKTASQHATSALKYAAPAAAIAVPIKDILVYVIPYLEPIGDPIQALLTVVFNLLLVYVVKIQE